MGTWVWILIAAALIVVLLVLVVSSLLARDRRGRLQERFGPEYDRTVESADKRRDAERELRDREERYDELELHPLSDTAIERYQQDWSELERRFVDRPQVSVTAADDLVTQVMREPRVPRRRLRHPERARLGRSPDRRRELPPRSRDLHEDGRRHCVDRGPAHRGDLLPGPVRGADPGERRPAVVRSGGLEVAGSEVGGIEVEHLDRVGAHDALELVGRHLLADLGDDLRRVGPRRVLVRVVGLEHE